MSFFALGLSDYSGSRFISRLRLSWRPVLQGLWSGASIAFGIMALTADQLYLEAWRRPPFSPSKLELAAAVFPFERMIATSSGYYYLLMNKANLTTLHEIKAALKYDPAAADLIKAEMIFSFDLGKNDEAVDAFNRLKRITPNAPIVKQIEGIK